jgi:uncharacterized protein YggL (DUF469 family)
MHQDEDLHAQLLAKFREYFEANQKWLNEGTKRSAIDLRRIMSEIRKICSERRVVVREWLDWKEEQLLERNQKRKAQDAGSDT